MFILQLNDMRASNVENLFPVARFETKENLEQFLEREKVEKYEEKNWIKAYRKDGPLEWYNPPYSFDSYCIDVGNADDWASDARKKYDYQILTLPLI